MSRTPAGPETTTEADTFALLRRVGEFVAPTTVVAALMYYFGYVSTSTYYHHFGLDLEQLGFSQQTLILRSVSALYFPLGCLLVLALTVRLAIGAGRHLVERGTDRTVLRSVGLGLLALGVAGFVRGVAGVLQPEIARTERVATTPLCLGAGVLLGLGGWWLLASSGSAGRALRPDVLWTCAGLVVLALFWATNSVAGAYGRGAAADLARGLPTRAELIVDTSEPLHVTVAGVAESALPAEDGHIYRYRYRDLRLLAASGERLFVVPASWADGERTVLILDRASVRVAVQR